MAAAARITDDDLALFQEQGFLLKRSFFSPEEAALLSAVARDDPFGRSAEGRRVELLGLPKGDPERPKATMYDALCYSERMGDGAAAPAAERRDALAPRQSGAAPQVPYPLPVRCSCTSQ